MSVLRTLWDAVDGFERIGRETRAELWLVPVGYGLMAFGFFTLFVALVLAAAAGGGVR